MHSNITDLRCRCRGCHCDNNILIVSRGFKCPADPPPHLLAVCSRPTRVTLWA